MNLRKIIGYRRKLATTSSVTKRNNNILMTIFTIGIFVVFVSDRSFAQPSLISSQDGEDLVIQLKNDSGQKAVYVNTFNNEWIGVKIQLWSAGRGVILRSSTNAKWRRDSAFVNSKWVQLQTKQPIKTRIKISAALPDSPINDALANEIYESFAEGETFEIVVVAEYAKRGDGKGVVREIYKKTTFKKMARSTMK